MKIENIKVAALCMLLFLFPLITLAQCRIDVEKSEQGPMYISGFEQIFIRKGARNNGDLSEGFQMVHARMLALGEKKQTWVLQVVFNSQILPVVIPRRVFIQTSLGRELTIDSDASFNNGKVDVYEFPITIAQKEILKQKIVTFDVIDTRKNIKTLTNPEYGLILAEQIACLEKW